MSNILGVVIILLFLLAFSALVVAVVRSFSCCPGCGQFDEGLFSEAIQAAVWNFDNPYPSLYIPPMSRRVCQECGYVLSPGAHLS